MNTTNQIIRVYYKNENCRRSAQIAGIVTGGDLERIDTIDRDDERAEALEMLGVSQSADCSYEDGTKTELLSDAIQSRAVSQSAYRRKVAANIISSVNDREITVDPDSCGDDLIGYVEWLDADGWDVSTDVAAAICIDGERIDEVDADVICNNLWTMFCNEQ
jgi:hypothetical protein